MAAGEEGRDWKVEASDTDLGRVLLRLRKIPEKTKEWTRTTLEQAADKGVQAMIPLAPESHNAKFPNPGKMSPATLESEKGLSLKNRIKITDAATNIAQKAYETSGRSFAPVVSGFQPGGVGGGGTMRIHFGPVPQGKYKANPHFDPAYIIRVGTGGRGKTDAIGKKNFGNIRPTNGNWLTFMEGNKQHFAKSTYGIRANDAWFEAGIKAARVSIKARTQALHL